MRRSLGQFGKRQLQVGILDVSKFPNTVQREIGNYYSFFSFFSPHRKIIRGNPLIVI